MSLSDEMNVKMIELDDGSYSGGIDEPFYKKRKLNQVEIIENNFDEIIYFEEENFEENR